MTTESPKFYRSLSVDLPQEAGACLPVTVSAQTVVGVLGQLQAFYEKVQTLVYDAVFSSSLSIAFGRGIPI